MAEVQGEFFVLREELHLRDLVGDGCTLVNDRPIDSEAVLREGDVISCGGVALFVLKPHRPQSMVRVPKATTQLQAKQKGAVAAVEVHGHRAVLSRPSGEVEKPKVANLKLWLAFLLTAALVVAALLQSRGRPRLKISMN